MADLIQVVAIMDLIDIGYTDCTLIRKNTAILEAEEEEKKNEKNKLTEPF